MAYSEGIFHMAIVSSASPASLASVADIQSLAIMEGMELRRIMLYVTTAPTTTATVINFYLRTSVGVTSGQISLGTLTIPVGTVAGSVVYKNLDSLKLVQGQCLAAAVTTASAAGNGIIGYGAYQQAEDPQNVAACIASA